MRRRPAEAYILVLMLACLHHVRENRTCGREFARAAAVKHGRAEEITLNHNAVVDTVHRVERILIAEEQREHADRDLISGKLRRTDKLNRSSELGRIAEVRAVNLRNALGVYILKVHLFARHERRKNRNLTAGVMSLDIRLRIPLRIAETLCIRKHIAELSAKRYDKLVPGAIGYVLLFIPNEAAYVAAVSSAPELSMEAYRKQIILINPTNLLMALQLTYNLWQSEKQSANVRDIYASAEKLYNKFTLFAESFAKLGDNLQTLSTTYEEAQKRLTTGRGNIISRLESWREKGLTPARSMPDALLDATADDDEA